MRVCSSILVVLLALYCGCNPCKNIDFTQTPAVPIGLNIYISDSFSFSEKDTLLLKKQFGKQDIVLNKWVNYYLNDTFILDSSYNYYRIINNKKIRNTPIWKYYNSGSLLDTTIVVFNKYAFKLVGVENITKQIGKCENNKQLLERHIWVNNIQADLLKNTQIDNIFKIQNGSLILIK